MGLINLQTNLKSLRFGNDRFHGGNSGQPYIQTPIPEQLGDFGTLDTDFLLRGGSRAVTDSVKDVERLGKYFTDLRNPSGLLFVAKQNLLSRTAVRTQSSGFLLNEGVYTPISTLIEAGGVAFGLHVNKQGLNPFNGPGSLRTYDDVVNPELGDAFSIKNTSKNRLVNLFGAKMLIPSNNISNPRFLKDDISINPQSLLSYKGGPGSILGIGSTQIKLTNPTVKNYIKVINDVNYLTYSIRALNAATVKTIQSSPINQQSLEPQSLTGNNALSQVDIAADEYDLNNYRSVKTYIPALHQIDFRRALIQAIQDNAKGITTLMSDAPSYNPVDNKTLEQRVNLGDPGNASNKNLMSYTNGYISGSTSGSASENSFDKINVLPIYQSEGPALTSEKPVNDLVKFRIGVYDLTGDKNIPKNYIHFRAFLNSISDQYDADWNPTQYIGRGEKFYTYGGFNRKVSLSWTVAAQSKIELIPMYKKLNYLASVCAPDYSSKGYMRGNIVTLTVGGYFYEQPGIITNLSYEMNDDNATWEIGINDDGNYDKSVKELPHVIKVTGFNFIPIHEFVPRLQQNSYDPTGNVLTDLNQYGPERYIALNNGVDNNYGKTQQ
jgi:hypothetical protein